MKQILTTKVKPEANPEQENTN